MQQQLTTRTGVVTLEEVERREQITSEDREKGFREDPETLDIRRPLGKSRL
jgi:hypothetical protein